MHRRREKTRPRHAVFPAWYCDRSEGPTIPFVTPLANCNIHKFCAISPLGRVTGNLPYYNTAYQSWFCDDFTPSSPTDVLDQCYIHSDCVPPLKPIYSSQFDAWICSDGKVSLGEQFDGCFIHSGTGRTRARVRARGTERDLPSA